MNVLILALLAFWWIVRIVSFCHSPVLPSIIIHCLPWQCAASLPPTSQEMLSAAVQVQQLQKATKCLIKPLEGAAGHNLSTFCQNHWHTRLYVCFPFVFTSYGPLLHLQTVLASPAFYCVWVTDLLVFGLCLLRRLPDKTAQTLQLCPAVSAAPSWCCNSSIRAVKSPTQRRDAQAWNCWWWCQLPSWFNVIFWSPQCLAEELLSKAIALWWPHPHNPHYSAHRGKITGFACSCNIATLLWNTHHFFQPFCCTLV